MATNHGFADGNKRTTLILLDTVLMRSGYRLDPIDDNEDIDEALEEMILGAAKRTHTFDEIKQWLTDRVHRLSPRLIAFLQEKGP